MSAVRSAKLKMARSNIELIRVATLNVRGLSERRRQNQLYRLVVLHDIDIVALQETKVESEALTERMVQPFRARYNVCVSHAVGKSGGCVLLVRQNLGVVVQAVSVCSVGRFVVCDCIFQSQEWRLICIYAPTKADVRGKFFDEIRRFFETERLIIFLGDFNCVLSASDKSSEAPFRDASTSALNEILNDFGLDDACESVSGFKTVRYTHFQGSSHARLDRVYVSLELLRFCSDCAVTPVSFSDHCLVSVTLGKKKKPTGFNWGLWKLNDQLLDDENFMQFVNDALIEIETGAEKEFGVKWERFKEVLKMKAIERAGEIANTKRIRQSVLENNLRALMQEECLTPGTCSEDIRSVKSELESIDKERFQGALIRARAQKFLLDEAPTKRALSTEKRYVSQNNINEISYNGRMTCDDAEIRTAFYHFYRSLFSSHTVDLQKFKDDFLSLLPQLDEETKLQLELPITVEEVTKAIDDLNNGKSPGPDGLTASFYKTFKDKIGPLLSQVFKEAYEREMLPPSFSCSHTILTPKSDDSIKLKQITGYRPISLTNVDYKILMKILARRLQIVIKDIVGPHQTCGIRGRSIVTNIQVARSILECCDCMGGVVAMLQIDLEKAFDQVSHEVLFEILEHINIGSVLSEGVRMAYKTCNTRVIVNKVLSERIPVLRSVRQGCPLSPLLFCIYIESFCRRVLANNSISGFVLQSCEVRVLAYADDIALFCVDKESISQAVTMVKKFCTASGSSVNWQKCVGFWHGDWETKPTVYENVPWGSTPTKYLGVPLQNYRDSDPYWRQQTEDLRNRAEKWGAKDMSVFARATACNLFFMSKVWYVMQVLHCSRTNIQKLHRIFAVFIWASSYEKTSRTNLFRRVRSGGLSLSHLFLRQVVNRFIFLRDVEDPFLRTVCQLRLARALPMFVVSTACHVTGGTYGYFREIVQATRFLCARFSMEYLISVTRKKLYKDLVEVVFPVPVYRSLYSFGPGQNVLKRVKRMPVQPAVKTFFFKLHVGVLPVKTWMAEKGMFVPWGVDCLLCRKPETVEHVFIDCWDGVFFWDVLQRTLQKYFPLNAHGIRFLAVQNDDGVPYDMLMLLGLHSMWKRRMAVRHADVHVKDIRQYFGDSVSEIIEVWKTQSCVPECISVLEKVTNLKHL